MKHKKWTYYILAFFIFILIMMVIDFKLEGIVAEYFINQILFDREKVIFIDAERVRGTLYWPRLKDILTFMIVIGFIFLEIIVYLTARYSENKEQKRIIDELEQRIALLTRGEVPKKIQELKLIDSKINELMRENELVKKEMSIEMGKKNDLVTYLAHDLKTPLTSIIGYLTILEESEVPENVQKDYIKKLLKKAYSLEDLTNQFFDIARFSLQEIPLNKNLLDAQFFLEQLTEELYPLLRKKNLKFYINVPEDMKLYVDGGLFARVLNNLLKNAIAYSCKDSTIKINGIIEDAEIKLLIENDGDVISSQELKLIFEKFYRRDKSRNQVSGAGLGLAISKEIIQRHHGSLEAESYDGHTIFIIAIPKSL